MRKFTNLIRITRLFRKMPFYAVAKGNRVGIFNTWDECKAQVNGYSGAKYKKFNSNSDAEAYLASNGVGNVQKQVVQPNIIKTEAPVKVPFVDFWPEDVSDDDEDNFLLSTVASQFDPIPLGTGGVKPNGSVTAQSAPKPIENGSRKRKAFDTSNKDGLVDMLKKLRKNSVVFRAVGSKNYGGHNFPVDTEGFVLVYTDGACERNGWHNAVAGLGVYFDDNHPLNASKPVIGRATNNAGEIQAACEAIRIAQKCNVDKLCVNTDSQFLINSVTVWMKSWKRKGWKLSDGNPIKNLQDYTTLDKLITGSPMQIKWNYVKGHAGIRGNEQADMLAKAGAFFYDKSRRK